MRPALGCSVVIPTFNAADVIEQQLAALAGQKDAAPFEVVVADNGSTDDLASAVAQWRKALPGLRVVDASRDRGVSVARNVGICLLYTSPSPRDRQKSRMPSSA